MKKTILIALLSIACLASKAQNKQDTTKVKYTKTITINESDFGAFYNLGQAYKAVVNYDPNIPDKDRSAQYRAIDAFLQGVKDRIKIDSVKVK